MNGERRDVPPNLTIEELLRLLAEIGRIAVEVNGAIVPKSEHPVRVVAPGDRIEIVHAIGGG